MVMVVVGGEKRLTVYKYKYKLRDTQWGRVVGGKISKVRVLVLDNFLFLFLDNAIKGEGMRDYSLGVVGGDIIYR